MAKTSSCISRRFKREGFAACKKAKLYSSISRKGPKGSGRKRKTGLTDRRQGARCAQGHGHHFHFGLLNHVPSRTKPQTCPIGLPRTELPRLLLVFSAKALFMISMAAFGVTTCRSYFG